MPLPSGTAAALGMPLFIRGYDAAFGAMPLFIDGGFVIVADGPTLYVSGVPGTAAGGMALFENGFAPASGGTALYMSGVPGTAAGGTTLFEYGSAPSSGGMTLFLGPTYAAASGGMPLHTLALAAGSGGMPLYEGGHLTASGQTTLFAWGHDRAELGHPFPLFVYAGDVPAASGGLSLSVAGSTGSGFAGGADLYLYSDPSGNVAQAHIPLSVRCDGPQSDVRNVNLWVAGEAPAAALGASLVAWNDQSGVAAGTALFVSGDGTAAGSLPYARGMNLALRRDPADALPLYLATPGTPASTGTSLFVRGSSPAALGATLAVPQTVGGPTQAVRLFTSGW